ncbi:hypothetical protein KR032_001986, partial [Drosophila birchii]
PDPSPNHLEELLREINEVKTLVQTEPHGNDLRMFLFTVAASSDRYESTLVPLPPQFRAKVGHGCQVQRLRRAIENNWPSLRVIQTMFTTNEELSGMTRDDMDAWHLLHWLLVPNSEYPLFRRLSILNLNPLCRIMGLGQPTEDPRYLISISYEQTNPQQRRWRSQTDETRYYGYLGLPLEKVYRFLYTGHLDIPPGQPIRLHHQMEFSLPLCKGAADQQQQKSKNPLELCWRNSIMSTTKHRALVICELPKELDESMARSPDKHFLEFVVLESASLKPCYLLMFDAPVATRMLANWPGNPIEGSLGPASSLRQRTSHRFSQMSNYFSERLDDLWRMLTKT